MRGFIWLGHLEAEEWVVLWIRNHGDPYKLSKLEREPVGLEFWWTDDWVVSLNKYRNHGEPYKSLTLNEPIGTVVKQRSEYWVVYETNKGFIEKHERYSMRWSHRIRIFKARVWMFHETNTTEIHRVVEKQRTELFHKTKYSMLLKKTA